MLKKFLFMITIFSVAIITAQEPFYKNYDWDSNPSYSVKNNSKDLVAFKEKIVTEFLFEGELFLEYFLEHRVLWLNSDDAIERYNRVYLPYTGDTDLLINKARVIQKDGEIITLDASKILTAEDEETGRKYKYFAFEGVEKGSYIEYFYIQKKSPSYTGKRLSFQDEFDKEQIEFDLFTPKNLDFTFKSYNGLPEVVRDTSTTDKVHWTMRAENIKLLDKESQSPYKASRGAIVYKLYKNNYNNKIITSYDNVAQNLYSYYYPKYDKGVQKKIDKLSDKIPITNDMDESAKARTIDSYVKQNIYYSEANNKSLEDLNSVLTNETANDRGMTKLYVALFKKFGIQNEMVLTCSGMDMKFDPKFESNNFLQEFLFYLPESKKYVSPTNFSTRFGFPPPFLTDNYGLFISEVTVGSFVSALAEIKYIDPVIAEDSRDVMKIDVSFDPEDLAVTKIKLERSMSGYNAMYIQPFLNFIDEDKKDDFIDEMGKFIDDNADVLERVIVDENPESFGIKPFELKFDIISESFVNKAGNKYLFKLGNLIGPQIEMYQEKKRVLPLESSYQRSYYRTIKVTIPEGYQMTNLDAINIQNTYSEEGKDVFTFHSFFTLEDAVLTVTVNEHYHRNIITPEVYEEYRTVINSAADFNKITLVLEPK